MVDQAPEISGGIIMVDQAPEIGIGSTPGSETILRSDLQAIVDAAVNKAVAAATGAPVREKKSYEIPQHIVAPLGHYLHIVLNLADAEKIQKATGLMAHMKQAHHGKTIAEFIFVVPEARRYEIAKALVPKKDLIKPLQR